MDIEGIGQSLIEVLVDKHIVSRVTDLYLLEKEQLANLDRMGEKSADKVLAAVEQSKSTTLARFLFALGIPEVGEATARSLAQHFGTWEALAAASESDYLEVDDVGPVVADHLVQFFDSAASQAVVSALRDAGVHWPVVETTKAHALPLAGETWVVTGKLEALGRNEAKEYLQVLGAKVAGSVSAKTNCLVAGPGAGSKLTKAENLGVPVIDEEALMALLRSHEVSL